MGSEAGSDPGTRVPGKLLIVIPVNVSGTGTNTNYYFQKTVACVVCFTIFGAPGSVANINITVYNYIFRCIFDLGVFFSCIQLPI